MKIFNGTNCSDHLYVGTCVNDSWDIVGPQVAHINVYDVNVPYPCSKFTRQQDTLLRYIFNSNDYLMNLEDGNIWQYPYEACNENNLVTYLNTKEVQEALHVNSSFIFPNGGQWAVCNVWNGNNGYNKTDDGRDMVPVIDFVLNNNVRVLIYSGTDDLVCAYLGSSYWINYNLSKPARGNETTGWVPWLLHNQTGGWYQQFTNFTFFTVRDAGHEVPTYQPARAYSMFQRFLANDYRGENITIDDHSYESYGSSSSSSDKTKNMAIGGAIGAGVTLGVFVIIGIIYYCLRRRGDTGYQKM